MAHWRCPEFLLLLMVLHQGYGCTDQEIAGNRETQDGGGGGSGTTTLEDPDKTTNKCASDGECVFACRVLSCISKTCGYTDYNATLVEDGTSCGGGNFCAFGRCEEGEFRGGVLIAGERKRATDTGDGGPAVEAGFVSIRHVAVDGAGNVFVADLTKSSGGTRIRKVSTNGTVSALVGNGLSGAVREGMKGSEAPLNFVEWLAADSAGYIYFSDFSGTSALWRVGADGILRSIPTESFPSGCGVGHGVIDSNGALVVAGRDAICRIGRDGKTAQVVAGQPGSSGYSGDGGPATKATFATIGALAADRNGNIYVASYGDHRIRKIDAEGTISTIVGTGQAAKSLPTASSGGTTASQRAIQLETNLNFMAVDSSGNLLFLDFSEEGDLRAVSPSGEMRTVKIGGLPKGTDASGRALLTTVVPLGGLANDSHGVIYATDGNAVVRVGTPPAYRTQSIPAVEGSVCPPGTAVCLEDRQQ